MWNPYAPLPAPARRGLGIAAVVIVLLAWATIAAMGLVSPAKLPAPWSVASAFLRLAWDGTRGESLLLNATIASVSRVVVASLIVGAVGLPLGIVMGASPKVDAFFSPLIDPFRSAPIVAILPILVMWFGIGEGMKIAFLFLGAFVYLVPMVRDALRAVPSTYWISAADLGARPFEAIRVGVLPLALPRIADALIVAVSVMWTYITVAEYVNAESGLGQLIQNARRFSAMDQVFVGIGVIVALSLITNQGLHWLKRRLFPWETE